MSQQHPGSPQYGGGMPSYSGPPSQGAYSSQMMAADRAAGLSLIFGIIGLFFLGIVFGPLAIWQASKAEKMNRPATPGKVLGWIDIAFGIGQIFLFLVIVGAFSTFIATSTSSF